MAGHVFVVAGDLTRIQCDGWLLPTDQVLRISASFAYAVGVEPNECISGRSWNRRPVMRFSDDSRIWLANVGTIPKLADAADFAAVVGPFVEDAVDQLGRPSDRKLLLAVNVIGSGEGGGGQIRGSIHRALLEALYAAADQYDVDLVLVCWRRSAYSAAQRSRQELLSTRPRLWELGRDEERLRAVAERLALEARCGRLVLFIGAGVSAGAGLPAWQDLLDRVASQVFGEAVSLDDLHKLDLRDQAAVLQRRLGDQQLSMQEAVRREIDRSACALTHALLASLPTNKAITTNYDQLFELAASVEGHRVAVLPYESAADDQRWLLKLHGSIDRDDSIVLTRGDYLTIPERHGALIGLVQAMLLTHHMLFVGYSLTDEDFHQLVHEVRQAQGQQASPDRLGTVLTLADKRLFAELWTDTLEVVPVSPEGEALDVVPAARRLQIFLDLVGFLATDASAHLLDESYASLLSEDEAHLRDLLRPVEEHLRQRPPGHAAEDRLRALLAALGSTEARG